MPPILQLPNFKKIEHYTNKHGQIYQHLIISAHVKIHDEVAQKYLE